MRLARFVVERVAEKGTRKVVHIGALDLKMVNGGRYTCSISNIRAFQIEVDEAGMIHNYSDRVMVSIQDSINRTIRVDTMSVLSIVNHKEVQRKINELFGINKLAEFDAVLEEVDQLNVKVAAYAQEVEIELLLEDLLMMNKERAIDKALDTGDVEAFMKLTGGRENELIETV